jgi:hypothetical protein
MRAQASASNKWKSRRGFCVFYYCAFQRSIEELSFEAWNFFFVFRKVENPAFRKLDIEGIRFIIFKMLEYITYYLLAFEVFGVR